MKKNPAYKSINSSSVLFDAKGNIITLPLPPNPSLQKSVAHLNSHT